MTLHERGACAGDVTAANVRDAMTEAAHLACVRDWAACVWAAWVLHHDTVRHWAEAAA